MYKKIFAYLVLFVVVTMLVYGVCFMFSVDGWRFVFSLAVSVVGFCLVALIVLWAIMIITEEK